MDNIALEMIGPSFEEIKHDELLEVNGGTWEAGGLAALWTSLPCVIGGTITIISYTIYG